MAFDQTLAERTLVEILDGARGGRPVGMGFGLFDDVIATACHCLPRSKGRVILPDPDDVGEVPVVVPVRQPATGQITHGVVLCADPCSDLALVKVQPAGPGPSSDSPSLIAEALPSVVVSSRPSVPCSVFICNHERRWVRALATATAISPLAKSDRVRSGTSGAPVFDEQGRVMGLVGSNDLRLPDASLCLLADHLPAWALRRATGRGVLAEVSATRTA